MKKQILFVLAIFVVLFCGPAYAQTITGLNAAEEKRLASYTGFDAEHAQQSKMADGERVLERTFPNRLQDHELFLQALVQGELESLSPLAHGRIMYIDIGPALGNSKHPGVTMLPIADILQKAGDGNVLVGIDLPEEVAAFQKNVRKNLQLKKPLDQRMIYLLGADAKGDVAKLINSRVYDATGKAMPTLDSSYLVIIRTANAIDIYASWFENKTWLITNARSLEKNNVLLFFNKDVLFKPVGQTTWTIIGQLSERGFRHNSRDTKLAKGERPYVLYQQKLADLMRVPGVLVASAKDDFVPFSKGDSTASTTPAAKRTETPQTCQNELELISRSCGKETLEKHLGGKVEDLCAKDALGTCLKAEKFDNDRRQGLLRKMEAAEKQAAPTAPTAPPPALSAVPIPPAPAKKSPPAKPKASTVSPDVDDAVTAALEKERQKKVADLEAKVQELQDKLNQRQQEIAALKKQLADTQGIAKTNNKGDGKILQQLQSELAATRQNLERTMSSLEKARVAQSECNANVAALQGSLQESQAKEAALSKDLQVAQQNAATPTAQVQAKEQENMELTKQLAQAQQQISDLQSELAAAKKDVPPAPELPPAPASAKKADKKVGEPKPEKKHPVAVSKSKDDPFACMTDPRTAYRLEYRKGKYVCIPDGEVDELVK